MNAELVSLTPSTDQRAKMAYVYIRQSSLMQVTHHAESTDLQYELVERAVALGWPRERVELIDEDLGKSGAHAEARGGFQRLLAEISLARVGLVLSFDASRLARNNRDWYQLLEVCSTFGTLIGDGERLYDPRLYHNRLLLGLSGMMSEAELHQLKQRMQATLHAPTHQSQALSRHSQRLFLRLFRCTLLAGYEKRCTTAGSMPSRPLRELVHFQTAPAPMETSDC